MKISAELFEKEAHKEIQRFLKYVGQTTWEKKIEKIRSLPFFPPPSPNLYRNYLASRNPLVTDIATVLKMEREGKSFRRHATAQLMKTCWYVKVINNLFHQCEPAVFKKIKSIVTDDDTIRSFLFELDIATNFLRKNFDVHFVEN